MSREHKICEYCMDIPNGILLARKTVKTQGPKGKGYRHSGSAVYSNDGKLVMAARYANPALRDRNDDNIDPRTVKRESNASVIYMGALTAHYGHFLLESLCRFWIFIDSAQARGRRRRIVKPNTRFAFTRFSDNGSSLKRNTLLRKVAECLQIDIQRFMLVTETTRFKNITVCEPSCEINDGMHTIHNELCNALVRKVPRSPSPALLHDRIFILRGTPKEKEIIPLLEEHGFTAISPSSNDFHQNIVQYNAASVIASFEGSGMHNVLFAKPNTISIVFGFRTDDSPAICRYTTNQANCNIVSAVSAHHIDVNQCTLIEIRQKLISILDGSMLPIKLDEYADLTAHKARNRKYVKSLTPVINAARRAFRGAQLAEDGWVRAEEWAR